jgi:CRISPR/Cas system-associated endonuclease/helicase Cas3
MARYIDIENIRKLFDNEYKSTRKLINEGETHLDNLAEGFSEATRVLDMLPTADVVPRSEVENKVILTQEEYEYLCACEVDYREQVVVTAREIFAEIEETLALLDKRYMFNFNPKQAWGVRGAMTEIAELKKKYIGE